MSSVCLIVQNYYDIDPRVRRKAEALVWAGYDVDVIALRPPQIPQRTYYLNKVRVQSQLGQVPISFNFLIFLYLGFIYSSPLII